MKIDINNAPPLNATFLSLEELRNEWTRLQFCLMADGERAAAVRRDVKKEIGDCWIISKKKGASMRDSYRLKLFADSKQKSFANLGVFQQAVNDAHTEAAEVIRNRLDH